MADTIEAFHAAILSVLGHAPDAIVPGRFHRFGTSDRRGDSAGWCKLFDDMRAGVFGCYRQGIGEAWSAVDRRTMNHATAMSAAILIGIQFWFADRGGLYVLWYAPLLVIIAFRPTTIELQPPTPDPGYSWSSRVAIAAWNRMMRKPSVQPPSLAA